MNRALARRALEAWQGGKPARLLDRALSIADVEGGAKSGHSAAVDQGPPTLLLG
jgi:hypothetical protein